MSWFVQWGRDDPPVQVPGVALVLRPGPEAGDAPPFVVGVDSQVQADGIVNVTQKAIFVTIFIIDNLTKYLVGCILGLILTGAGPVPRQSPGEYLGSLRNDSPQEESMLSLFTPKGRK
ncbi:MAG: hypothetical protein P8129_03140 [Anaerolineae bacterium]